MIFYTLIFYFSFCHALIYECPNYKILTQPRERKHNVNDQKQFHCNFIMTNPKKVINPYKIEVQNYVQSKPFGSICLKCSMCLAVAKELDAIFKKTSEPNRGRKQIEIVNLIKERISSFCGHGFENYDLRKFKQYQIVTDDVACSTHVRTRMDGKWTEKLREMCTVYSNYMDIQYLLNDYLKGNNDIAKYLCNNEGMFRDCSSLDFRNTSINPEQKNNGYVTKC